MYKGVGYSFVFDDGGSQYIEVGFDEPLNEEEVATAVDETNKILSNGGALSINQTIAG